MASQYLKDLNRKLKGLENYIFGEGGTKAYQEKLDKMMNRSILQIPYTVYISPCDTKTRTHVCHGIGDSLAQAWDNAVNSTKEWLKRSETDVIWLKIEIVSKARIKPIRAAVEEMFSGYNEFYRHGISLDHGFKYSFTEGELNGNRLINYKEKNFNLNQFNNFLLERDDDFKFGMPTDLVVFDCEQYFCDDKDRIYTLYRDGLNCGRRISEHLTRKDIQHVINTGARYLTNQVHKDGTFDYGYYPVFHKLIPNYNILRHTSTIWSLICAAEINHDRDIYQTALSTIKYTLSQIEHYDDGTAYLIEKTASEIKLGGNAVTIILLTQFMNLYETDEYTDLCRELGGGILRMFDMDTGKFVHVLNSSDRSLKEAYRTVYYDGEAAFALARLYSLTKEDKWLDAARRSVDHFIEADYTKQRDHWVAYAVNELTKYVPEEKYFEFGLRNVQANLKRIYQQETSYHTYLELLMAAFDMYMRMLSEGHKIAYMSEFDERGFLEAIFHRAHHMLNGYAYPEYVMYFKKPSHFTGSFFVRHDGYRTRIDDVQHFCGAYIAVYKKYDELVGKYRELTGREEYVEEYERI